jgi:hypothetical protein
MGAYLFSLKDNMATINKLNEIINVNASATVTTGTTSFQTEMIPAPYEFA